MTLEKPPIVAMRRATSVAVPAARRSGAGRLRLKSTALASVTPRSPRKPREPIVPSAARVASVTGTPVETDQRS